MYPLAFIGFVGLHAQGRLRLWTRWGVSVCGYVWVYSKRGVCVYSKRGVCVGAYVCIQSEVHVWVRMYVCIQSEVFAERKLFHIYVGGIQWHKNPGTLHGQPWDWYIIHWWIFFWIWWLSYCIAVGRTSYVCIGCEKYNKYVDATISHYTKSEHTTPPNIYHSSPHPTNHTSPHSATPLYCTSIAIH